MTTDNVQAIRELMEYDNAKKSPGLAYAFWFFLGALGGHRFYMGDYGIALVQVILFLIGFPTMGITWVLLGVWWLFDAFLIPANVRRHNRTLMQR